MALLFGLSLNVALSEPAAAVDWPDGYVLYENTTSPDGRYGVLVPTMEAWDQDESLGEANYLADVKNHRVLGKIDKVDYFEHQNDRGVAVFWAPQSSICVVENDGCYGVDSISVPEISDSSFAQTDIGDRIQKALDGAMTKQATPKWPEMFLRISDSELIGRFACERCLKITRNNSKT